MNIPNIILLFLCLFLISCDMLMFPRNVEISNPEQVIKDARILIEKFNKMPKEEREQHLTRYGCHSLSELLPEYYGEIPESLKLIKMRHGFICEDRVSLVFHRNPDNDLGLRVWREDVKDRGSDKPTKWAEIYTYYFNNDSTVSRKNLP